MSIVNVQHPVPVSYIPRGGRNRREFLRREVTPVRMREESPDAFRHVHSMGRQGERPLHALHEFEGRLWLRLRGRRDGEVGGLHGFGPRRFVDYLEGREPLEGIWGTDLTQAFYGSPLMAVPEAGGRDHATIRGAHDLVAGARVVVDEGERAKRRLADFLEQRLVVAGDAVFIRAEGPIAVPRHGAFSNELSLAPLPRVEWGPSLGIRIDRWEEFDRMRQEIHGLIPGHVDGAAQAALAAIPPDLIDGDDDVRLFVNTAPRHLAKEVRKLLLDRPLGKDEQAERIAAQVDRLDEWARLGDLGMIGMDEAADIVVPLHQAIYKDLFESFPFTFYDAAVRLPYDFAERVALPRLAPAPVTAEDADALSDLLPGGP